MSRGPHISSDELSTQRTVMAADRTMMAWTRTSLAMIGFGFTIYKFLQYLHEEEGKAVFGPVRGPRHLGMALITLGVVSLIIGGIQHWQTLRALRGGGAGWWNLPLFVAGCVALLGVAALASIAFRIGPF